MAGWLAGSVLFRGLRIRLSMFAWSAGMRSAVRPGHGESATR
jgi:hypothetical protein